MAVGEHGPAVPATEPPATARPSGRRRAVRVGLGVLALGLFAYYLSGQAGAIADGLQRMSPLTVLGAAVAVVLALLANALSWRAVLRGLGSDLPLAPAARVYLVAQIGKYLPGSVWPVLAQVELARDYAVPRRRSAAAALIALVLGLAVAVALAAVTLVAAGVEELRGYAWVLGVVPLVAVALHPAVLGRGVDLLARLLRRPPIDARVRGRDLLVAAAWSVVMWVLFGVHIWLLGAGLGLGGADFLLLAVGAYAAAWVGGFVVLFLPAGAGAREAVLWLVLGTVMSQGDAVAIALVSRALTVLGDGITSGGAALAARRRAGADRARR